MEPGCGLPALQAADGHGKPSAGRTFFLIHEHCCPGTDGELSLAMPSSHSVDLVGVVAAVLLIHIPSAVSLEAAVDGSSVWDSANPMGDRWSFRLRASALLSPESYGYLQSELVFGNAISVSFSLSLCYSLPFKCKI